MSYFECKTNFMTQKCLNWIKHVNFAHLRQEALFFPLINYRSLKGRCDAVTFEIVKSDPRKQDAGESLGTTSVVGVDI